MGLKNAASRFNEYDKNGRVLTIRQDRIECDPERFKLSINGNLLGITNFSAFGVAVESREQCSDSVFEGNFCVDNFSLGTLSFEKIREEKVFENYRTGLAIVGSNIDVESILAIKELNITLEERLKSFQKHQDISKEFKVKVLEIKDFLLKLQKDISSLEKNSFEIEKHELDRYEDIITSRISMFLSEILSSKYHEIESILKGLSQEDLDRHFKYFQENVGEIFYLSAYAHRAYFKPKGYAGDFEMMNHVYQREARGGSLFAKCLNRYFVDEPAGRAVRNREQYLRNHIMSAVEANKGALKILSVASGPAKEIQNFIKMHKGDFSKIEFYLLDQDLDALKHAQRKIENICRETGKSVRLKLINTSIKEVINKGLPEKEFDLIYSAGLFDYFTDPVAIYAAQRLAEGLKTGGQLIIGNFSVSNPNQFAMDLIMDWQLLYRSPEQMQKLFGNIGSHYKLEQEEQGINLFATIKK